MSGVIRTTIMQGHTLYGSRSYLNLLDNIPRHRGDLYMLRSQTSCDALRVVDDAGSASCELRYKRQRIDVLGKSCRIAYMQETPLGWARYLVEWEPDVLISLCTAIQTTSQHWDAMHLLDFSIQNGIMVDLDIDLPVLAKMNVPWTITFDPTKNTATGRVPTFKTEGAAMEYRLLV